MTTDRLVFNFSIENDILQPATTSLVLHLGLTRREATNDVKDKPRWSSERPIQHFSNVAMANEVRACPIFSSFASPR